ncbi:transposase [Nocardia farcinica]|uniref:pPIWI_RE_Z domain-containing protein n=1 Tax=Nocardia farcinica TaxID=37329 RepID=UPI000BF58388|nr:transposase [Nocardia farcinica]MBF6263591.1 transposase [Nocardia farcinica]MBF6282204.1 transposase [Nocardia farcinica]MBF6306382.1 transposase [Nocardia farcinica]MBF6489438.1 transposase [Nocardia farcinica]MBF6508252.1 transposase [Nocardia farcinica]
MELGTFLDVELGITLVQRVCPDEPVTVAPELLTGYPLLEALGVPTGESASNCIAAARHLLGPLRTRRDWETAMRSYLAVAEDLRGYRIDDAGHAVARPVSVADGRFQVYDRALDCPPALSKRTVRTASAGSYVTTARGRPVSVEIPEELTLLPKPPAHSVEARADRKPLTFTWEELAATAAALDEREASANSSHRGNWIRLFTRLRLRVRENDEFTDSQQLTITGMLHLIGMVGAGKSTLMKLLAVCAADRGLHVTLVEGDTLSCLRTAAWLREMGVRAAPLIGESSRHRHINRLHQVHAAATDDGMALTGFEPAADLLSTACALDALRPTTTPWEFQDAPCRDKLTEPTDDGTGTTFGCPLWTRCQRHDVSRAAVDASVWVATTASLVFSRVPQELNREQLRYLELVWRRSDLVIIDEADRVQAQLDEMFSPDQTLIGHDDAWLETLMDHTERELRIHGRAQFNSRPVREWVTRVNTARTTANRLYALLRRNPLPRDTSTMVQWIGRDCFTEWTLADKLVRAWAGNDVHDLDDSSYTTIRTAFDQFLLDPLGRRGRERSPLATELVDLAESLVNLADEEECARLVTRWLRNAALPQPIPEDQIAETALRLEFTALLAVLSNTLNSLTRGWRAVEGPLNFDAVGGLTFQRPPEDYTPVVPAPPMGAILGYQYQRDSEQSGRMGTLRFFRCAGVGRWLLLELHRLFVPDSSTGPAVLLMSGTSWAGTSPRYDVQIPVGAILQAPAEELRAVDDSTFFLENVRDEHGNAVSVSGLQGLRRRSALRQLLREFASRHRPGDPSRFEKELAQLPPQRRRILILVGSYREAEQVAEDLVDIRSDWRHQVLHLVADHEEFTGYWKPTLRRGDVARLADTDATFLVAPLLAIERGHNILNPAGEAALGSAYFLVRPHPRPDEIAYPVQSMNRWAVEQIDALRSGHHCYNGTDLHGLARKLRGLGYRRWQSKLTAPMVYGSLDRTTDRPALAWTQLVTIWQVIGRLVRGGCAARVHFCDAKFAPDLDDPDASLLVGMHRVLDRYLGPDAECTPADRELAESLYGPFHRALAQIPGVGHASLH